MTALLVPVGHALHNVTFGWMLLSLHRHDRSWAEALLLSLLVGMYAETLMVATLMFLGVPLVAAGVGTLLGMSGFIAVALYRGGRHHPPFFLERPKWYEWALLATIGEKVLFVVWQLTRTETYFNDALMHWSGRARSLFGAVNWSLDPSSPAFLAGDIGNSNYPLQTIIWRALTARLNGEWNEVVSRFDGLLFFMVIVGTVWLAVWRFSNRRWLAAAAGFVVVTVPLHALHAAAGYSDIAVEAFTIAALAALLRREWFGGGVVAAGATWSKNDALILYLPALLVASWLLQGKERTGWQKSGCVARFLLGFATILPWLIFNYLNGLGFTPGRSSIEWHLDAPLLFWENVMKGPTSSILWIAVFSGAAYSCVAMFRDRTGRALISAFLISFGSIAFTFSATGAYTLLMNQTTIHRVMLQFSSVAIVVTTYGLWLQIRSAEAHQAAGRRHRPKSNRRPERG